MSVRSDIQYDCGGSVPGRRYVTKNVKSPIEHVLDYEAALQEISKLPPADRKSALAQWKKNYRR